MRWADLFSIEVPQDLYQEIEHQRQACEKIIVVKDRLITGLYNGYHVPGRGLLLLGAVGAVASLWRLGGDCI
jgi:hypothetical protein